MIECLEQEIEQECMNKSSNNMELKKGLKSAIISLDRGEDGESLNEICSLAYLPTWAMPKLPQNINRRAIENWLKL